MALQRSCATLAGRYARRLERERVAEEERKRDEESKARVRALRRRGRSKWQQAKVGHFDDGMLCCILMTVGRAAQALVSLVLLCFALLHRIQSETHT